MRVICDDICETKRGRLLGLDIGDKTIGISVSDDLQMVASSVTIINRTSLKRDLSSLDEQIKMLKPIAIVYGWPLQMDGTPGSQCEKVQAFIEAIEPIYADIPLIEWDERFSTKVTNSVLLDADMSRKRRKDIIDKMAATYILQGALDRITNLRRRKDAQSC